MSRTKTHKDVEFAVDDPGGRQRTFKTFDEAATVALADAATTGSRVNLDVIVWSRAGANWWGGGDAEDAYDEDPDASVFERFEVHVNRLGRVP